MTRVSANNPISNLPTKIGIVATIAIVAFVTVLATWFAPSGNEPSAGDNRAEVYPASMRAIALGCGDTYHYKPTKNLYGVIPQSVLDTEPLSIPKHPMIVPVYGYMADTALTEDQIRFYTPDETGTVTERQVLRTMYDYNTTVIWYDPLKASGANLADIQNFISKNKNVMALPWTGEILPMGRMLAFSTWGSSQTCDDWSPVIFNDFQKFTKDNPTPRPDMPPVAKLNSIGALFLIDPNGIYTQK